VKITLNFEKRFKFEKDLNLTGCGAPVLADIDGDRGLDGAGINKW
tara:strand:+ start:361 stop:495 length:135 start_codon:yes stop_codon:yes gene_type:complete